MMLQSTAIHHVAARRCSKGWREPTWAGVGRAIEKREACVRACGGVCVAVGGTCRARCMADSSWAGAAVSAPAAKRPTWFTGLVFHPPLTEYASPCAAPASPHQPSSTVGRLACCVLEPQASGWSALSNNCEWIGVRLFPRTASLQGNFWSCVQTGEVLNIT